MLASLRYASIDNKTMASPLSAGLMVMSLRVHKVLMLSVSIGVRLWGVGLAANLMILLMSTGILSKYCCN